MTVVESEASQFRRERLEASRRGLILPGSPFALIVAPYLAGTAAIVMIGGWVAIALVPVSGLVVVMLFVVGHDACHQSFTSSPRLNGWIGRIAFLPSLHVFSLWEREHNRRHH